MKTYNKSEIFTNAWKLVKSTSMSLSDALKSAWKALKAVISLDKIVEGLDGKFWSKNGIERVYCNHFGYNTKKMKTTAYAFIQNGKVEVSVFVECFNQPVSWCIKEADKVKNQILRELLSC